MLCKVLKYNVDSCPCVCIKFKFCFLEISGFFYSVLYLFYICGGLDPGMQNLWAWRADHMHIYVHICICVCVSVPFSSVAQSCPTLCDPMNRSTPGLPVHHQLPEFTQTQVYRVRDAIQPSHPRSSPSPPAPNPPQHQSLFQWVNSSHEVAKVLELQL